MRDEARVLDWIRTAHETSQWTTSVCTGSLILGAAGLLEGLRATSHWTGLDVLRDYGAEPTLERVVVQGKIVTAAGVSSGIDMALWLAAQVAGEAIAHAIQLAIEYDPQPPFDAGARRTRRPGRSSSASSRPAASATVRSCTRPTASRPQRYLTRRDRRRSARTLPPVWHVGQ